MDIVVKGRHFELSDRFREHVHEKLDKVERFDPKAIRADVEVSKEANPRMAEQAFRVEITCRGRGPVIRAEAAADDQYAALDLAWGKLENRLRRAADRRNDHRSRDSFPGSPANVLALTPPTSAGSDEAVSAGPIAVDGDGPLVVREKAHEADAMSLDQALYEMELVGHDFYLYQDAETRRPSVVYRRRGYDYGVIYLDVRG